MYQPVIEVDLTLSTVRERHIPTSVRERWVGGTGLGLHLLSQELGQFEGPRDPRCPVFLLTGPLTGTVLPSSSDLALTTINADLPHHTCTSHAHGFLGARLRQAGLDGLIVRGRADDLVYLKIDDSGIEICEGAGLADQDTFETTRLLRAQYRPYEVSVACIGSAGENEVAGASVRVDEFSGFNHGGAGVIFGSKNLKAIAVLASDNRVPLHDPGRMEELAADLRVALDLRAETASRPPFGRRTRNLAMDELVQADQYLRSVKGQALGINNGPLRAELGRVPGKNFTDQQIGVRFGRRLKEDLKSWKVEPVASFNCDIACHHRTTCTTGEMAGLEVVGFAAEALEELGPNLGIEDPSVALGLANLVDGLGMAASSAPLVIAMLMEAYAAEEVTADDLDGVTLEWGNAQGVATLLDKTAHRQGVGGLIAEGIQSTAQAFGIEHRAVHMKWSGFQDYDQRSTPMFLFQSQIASGAGPTGVMHTSLAWGALEPDLGIREALDPADLSYVAATTLNSQIRKYWQDCIGLCQFAAQGIEGGLRMQIEAVQAATGVDMSDEEALELGERIIHLQRLIQLRLGFSPEEDFVIAERLLKKLDDGPAVGIGMNRYELEKARNAYYDGLDWSVEDGAPSRERLAAVGLGELSSW